MNEHIHNFFINMPAEAWWMLGICMALLWLFCHICHICAMNRQRKLLTDVIVRLAQDNAQYEDDDE